MVVHDEVSGLAPAVDIAAGLERMMGDRAMYERVLARFRTDYRDAVGRIRTALAGGDTVLAQRLAHTLKGAAAMIEADGLHQGALALETALRAGGALDAAMLARLEAELKRVMAQLDALPAAPALPQAAPAPALDGAELAQLCRLLDLGDSAAQDLIEEHGAGLRTLLGAARMAQLQAAMACFDFEGALHMLRPALAGRADELSG